MRRAGVGAVVVAVVTWGIAQVWWAPAVNAHCDAIDGPVVTEAVAALERSDVTPLLKWVAPEHEDEIRAVFKRTLAVRGQGADAKELADTLLFETLVRLHRAGEGAPYTGLKPAGHVDPALAAADQAIAAGTADQLARELGLAAERGVKERFERVLAARKYKDQSVEAGRKYVAAYVLFVHYVEGLHVRLRGGASRAHGDGRHEGEGHGS